jgi:hypothetical protein
MKLLWTALGGALMGFTWVSMVGARGPQATYKSAPLTPLECAVYHWSFKKKVPLTLEKSAQAAIKIGGRSQL